MINRYTQLPVAMYNPLSMEELAFAPSFLRQRHDQAASQLSDLGIQAGQYDVLNDYQNIAGQLVDPLQTGINELANNLATQGVNRSNAVPQALKLKSQYANLFGQNGAIGQLENATKQYREQAKQIQEFFKESPELARYITSQLRPGEATLKDGKVQLGEMSTPTYVKDIPEAEILESLNDAASKIKPSDLGDLGITSRQGVNAFDQIVTLASQKGVKAQQAFDLITNLVGQEQMNSLLQRGSMMGLTPEETKQNFVSKLKGIATSNAYLDTDRTRMKFTDELSLAAAKKEIEKDSAMTSWDYDPTTQEISIGGFDDSYFKEHKPQDVPGGAYGMDASGRIVLPTNQPAGDMGSTKLYKPFSPQQELEAFEIISSLSGRPISEIPKDYINSKAGRAQLKEYYSANKGKIQVQPTIDNTDQLREYGGDPEKATKDLYDNYQSRILFDVKDGRQLTPEEFEGYLEQGKLQVRGVYSSENPFGFIANNATAESLASPLAVNLKDDNGKVIKTFAISRSPQYQNTASGFYDTQFNSIYNNTIRTPNIDKNQVFTYVNDQGQSFDVPIKVKYNSDTKSFTVSSIAEDFKTFKVNKVQDIANGIKVNAN